MNFEYYRIFYYVAKYKNLTQAAAALMRNQPNVTRVMNNLEHELGCRLFVRSNRGITLTAEGEQLYTRVAVAFEQLQLGEAELAQDVALERGVVYIGASETALHALLIDELSRFHRQYPKVRLKIFNFSTPQALRTLKSGQIDFAVVTSPTNTSAPLREVRLQTFRDVLVGGPQFAGLAGKPLRLADLANYPLICLGQGTRTYDFYSKYYLEHGLVLEPDIEAATTDLILPMVKNDLGLGFLPQSLANDALRTGQAVQLQLEEPLPERYICLVYDTQRAPSVAARALQGMLCSPRGPQAL